MFAAEWSGGCKVSLGLVYVPTNQSSITEITCPMREATCNNVPPACEHLGSCTETKGEYLDMIHPFHEGEVHVLLTVWTNQNVKIYIFTVLSTEDMVKYAKGRGIDGGV